MSAQIERRPWPPDTRYLVGDDGSIIGPYGRVLRGSQSATGYLLIHTGAGRKYAHAMVCETFHGPRPVGADVAHGNGIRTDNRASNLRWATRTENLADRREHGTSHDGERGPGAKLTNAEAAAIRAAFTAGESRCELAARYGVTPSNIARIIRGDGWRNVVPTVGCIARADLAIGERHANAKLTEADIRAIRAAHALGTSQSKLAQHYGVTRPNIGYIVRRHTWAHVA